MLVGITGAIGSGKSLLARLLAEARGWPLIDADRIGHEALLPGAAPARRVIARFGTGVLGKDGAIDRARLAAQVFADPAALSDLDAIVHPWIVEQVRLHVDSLMRDDPTGIILLDAAVLLAWLGRLQPAVVVLVRAPRGERLTRLLQRGLSREDALLRMEAQERPGGIGALDAGLEHPPGCSVEPAGAEARAAGIELVVYNGGSREELRASAGRLATLLDARSENGKEIA